jgi:hypothetical protein
LRSDFTGENFRYSGTVEKFTDMQADLCRERVVAEFYF